ncbi:MAG: hypothetical protein JZU64_09960 [Rhodoferax sp.]|nr:hypothetical protein [Rhodoferax sp.]
MSRKLPPPIKKPITAAVATNVQVQTALVHLEKGRYRDAVACYKALLKTERRPEWLVGLAAAYAGRAKGLAAKGMLQEAIGLWRSRAELCGTPLWDGPYAGWLVRDGRLAEALAYLAQQRASSATPPDGQRNDEIAFLEAQLAPGLLTADKAMLALLPAESLLLRHRPHALAALTAYSSKDAAALEQALAEISFRSPYRDLRTLLKAMLLWETDEESARSALVRLPEDGPFEPLAAPLRTLLISGPERLRRWAGLDGSQQAMALDLLGCPPTLASLLRTLAETDVHLAPAALFDLVQRHSRDLPEPLATRVWQWLAPWATRRGCASPRIFGHPSPAAEECATALAVEISGDWDHAENHWAQAAILLASSQDPQDRLRAALVWRHIALASEHLSRDGVIDKTAERALTQSLTLDPDDCDVHVRLVQYWRRNGNLKRSREQLDLALVHFPDNVALLAEAIETALAAGSFKKAATTARQLLELDPLNRKARSLLGNAHLSHAVKQISAGKLEAAKKEIKEAANWLESALDQGRMQLLQAWCQPAASVERLRLARLAAVTWGAGLAAGWRLLREAQGAFARAGTTTLTGLLSEAGISTAKVLLPADVLELVLVLEQEAPLVRKGQDPLLPWRKAIIGMARSVVFDAQETIRICEALSRHQEHDLVEQFANAARKRWPDQPIFVFHAVAARFHKNGCIETDRDYDDLDDATVRARQRKDMRLVMRMEALFEDDDSDSEPDFDFDSDAIDLLDDLSSPGAAGLPAMFDKMGPQALRTMIELATKIDGGTAFLKQARNDMGDVMYRQIEKECGGNKKLILERIINMMMSMMGGEINRPPPHVLPKIGQSKAPVKGQGAVK